MKTDPQLTTTAINCKEYELRLKEEKPKNEVVVIQKMPMKDMVIMLYEDKVSGVDLYKAYGNLTVSKIIEEKPTSLVAYKKTENMDELRKSIARYLMYLCSWFDSNVKNMHAIDISEKMLSTQTLNHLTFEDLYIMGEQLKSQKTFGKLTPAVLLRTINNYAEYKLEQVQSYNREQHLRTKDDPSLSERIRSRGKTGHHESTVAKKLNQRNKWNENRE